MQPPVMSTEDEPLGLGPPRPQRNLRAGLLQEKDVEKALSGLPDLEAQTEPFSLAQPALDGDDEDDDDLGGDDANGSAADAAEA